MREDKKSIYEEAMKHYVTSNDNVKKTAKMFQLERDSLARFLKQNGVKIARNRRIKYQRKKKNKKYNISKETWDGIGLGKKTDGAIASELKVSRRCVCNERLKRGIRKFYGLYMTQEGEQCRSKYEAMYDLYLHENSILHEHEVKIQKRIADFKIGSEYHEICGMIGFARYEKRHEQKKKFYEENKIPVKWLYPLDIEKLYTTCKGKIICRERFCLDCRKETIDIVKNVCRDCYMKRWHDKGEQKTCESCKNSYISPENDNRKFCSHECYSQSIKKVDYDFIFDQVSNSGKSIHKIAIENEIKPSTLYMILRRKSNKEKGLTGEGVLRKQIRNV